MKRTLLPFAILLLTAKLTFGQLTIGTADLPSAGNLYRVSIANPLAGADYTITGPNYNWNFSQLTPQSQRVDTFLSVSSTNIVFSVVFINSNFNANRANVATGGSDFNLGTVTVNDVYNFYYNSSASYAQVGFGATIAGIPAPFTYNPKDIVYAFPLQYGDVDTSRSSYEVDVTSTVGFYFKVNRTRVNQVDGWGSLTTPYGTHNALRVKTTITERDSVYIDSLGFGFNLPPFTNIEYKWFGAGEGVPLLQANASANGNVNQVLYRDDVVYNPGIAESTSLKGIDIFPNPVADQLNLANLSGVGTNLQVMLLDMQGKVVGEAQPFIAAGSSVVLPIAAWNLESGNYLVRVTNGEKAFVKLITVK